MEKHPIQIERVFNIAKINTTPQSDLQIQDNPFQNFHGLFAEMEKSTPKLMWNYKGPWTVKSILKKKNKAGQFTRPNFKNSYKATKSDSVILVQRQT